MDRGVWKRLFPTLLAVSFKDTQNTSVVVKDALMQLFADTHARLTTGCLEDHDSKSPAMYSSIYIEAPVDLLNNFHHL